MPIAAGSFFRYILQFHRHRYAFASTFAVAFRVSSLEKLEKGDEIFKHLSPFPLSGCPLWFKATIITSFIRKYHKNIRKYSRKKKLSSRTTWSKYLKHEKIHYVTIWFSLVCLLICSHVDSFFACLIYTSNNQFVFPSISFSLTACHCK